MRRGSHHTPQAKAKISAALKGRVSPNMGKPMSAETKAKISASKRARAALSATLREHYGFKHAAPVVRQIVGPKTKGPPKRTVTGPLTAEHKAKISAARMGHKTSAETRAKIGAAGIGRPGPRKGVQLSAETKARISASKRAAAAKKREHAMRISLALVGRTLTPEHRAKIGATQRGKPKPTHSPETKAKMSATHTKRWGHIKKERRSAAAKKARATLLLRESQNPWGG